MHQHKLTHQKFLLSNSFRSKFLNTISINKKEKLKQISKFQWTFGKNIKVI